MARYRIYDLSKEFKIDNKVLMDLLQKNNVPVKVASNTIGDAERDILVKALNATKQPKEVPSKSEPKGGKDQLKKNQSKNGEAQPKQQPAQQANKQAPQAKQSNTEKQANKQQKNNSGNNQGGQQRSKQQGNKGNNGNKPQQPKQGGENQNQNRQKGNSGAKPGNGNQQQRNNNVGGNNNSQRSNDNRQKKNEGSNANAGNVQKQNKNRDNSPSRGERNGERSDRGGRNDRNNREERRGNKGNERSRQQQNQNGNGFSGNRMRPNKNKNKQQPQQPKETVRPKSIKVGEFIVVKELASKLCCTAAEVIKKLFLSYGKMANINEEIDFDTAALIATEYGVEVEELPPETDLTEIPEFEDDPRTLVLRPPVVTVMGHVDHGKTSLLDVIRKTSVTAHEAGGITQHIGAYQVKCQGKKIVFLDTPGHEAFTEMRARGAQVTDIAILVVAADDGVMPQTIEAINHAKSADVPIIVAVNKIDKPGADPNRVKTELMEHGLVPEEFGGDTIMVEVSAKKNINIDELLEMVLLVAEMRELKANPKRDARGVIIEAQLDKGRGSVATVLVQKGTLHIGDSIVAGTCFGKIRAMVNDRGENVKKAGPSVPVEVLGLNGVPSAGDELAVLDEKLARTIAEKRIEKQHMDLIRSKKVSLDDLFQQIQEGSIKDLNILVKADVQGTVEALSSSLLALNKNDEVRVNIIHSGVGAVNESDVMLASASNALVIAFNVRPDANARKKADDESIDIRTYRVIYDAINDVKTAMSGMLAPKFKEEIQGRVEIRQVMTFNKTLIVAGSYVLEGKITNKSKVRIVRDNIEVFDGELDDLRRFKDSVKEVAAGYECGITIKDYRDFKEGDIVEAYTMVEIATNINDLNKD